MTKKLEKNGLWESSRMILPEHREALVRRGQPPEPGPRPNVPTEEELRLIRDYALLPIVMSIVENNFRKLNSASIGFKMFYIAAIQRLMELIHADFLEVKKALKKRNIKIYEEEHVDGALLYRFSCRGYEDSFAIIRDVVLAEAGVKIGGYINAMFKTPVEPSGTSPTA